MVHLWDYGIYILFFEFYTRDIRGFTLRDNKINTKIKKLIDFNLVLFVGSLSLNKTISTTNTILKFFIKQFFASYKAEAEEFKCFFSTLAIKDEIRL